MQQVSLDKRKKRSKVKPFLKWVGGKGQLINDLVSRLPKEIKSTGKIEKYVEPFVGGGAFFFFLVSHFDIKKSYLCDINRELVIAYRVIKSFSGDLIDNLKKLEQEYLPLSENKRKSFYYRIRDKYNEQMPYFNYEEYNNEWINRSSYLIFLNKTCFNGLFRQNKKGEFNVPFGRYKNPTICDEKNIIKVSAALNNTEIFCADFEDSKKFINRKTLVYFDPPYRPISNTSSFTGYFKDNFNNKDQKRLASFFNNMDKRGAFLILSNSDPKNYNPNDDFFDKLYKNYNIEEVFANRMINCNAGKRGEITELIITNY